MSDVVRQVRASLILLVRYLARRSVRSGAGPQHAPSRIPWFLVLSAVWALYVGRLIWMRFDGAAHEPDPDGQNGMAWQLVGLVSALVGFGLVELAPETGRIRPPLRIALLDELPFATAARLLLAWFRNPLVPALTLVGVFAWCPAERDTPLGILSLSLFGLALYLAATTLGYALGTWARVAFSARGRRVIGIGALVFVLVGVQLLVFSDLLSSVAAPSLLSDAVTHLRTASTGPLAAVLAAVWVLALVAIFAAERKGYDRFDATPTGARRSLTTALDHAGMERLLTRREGGLGLAITGWLFFGVVAVGAGFALAKPPPSSIVARLTLGGAIAIAYLGAVMALSRAGQAVRRDAGARPLLAPLPLTPWQTLTGKVRAIRGVILPLILSIIPGAILAIWQRDAFGPTSTEMLWRLGLTAAALWVAVDAGVSIAFLTGGVGLPGMRSLGAPTSFAVQLLLLPLIAVAAAPDPIVGGASLVTVWAIAFEARRAAHRAVRWLDDAADDVERETTVWRALLALAAFYAAQALGAQLLGLGELSPSVTAALTYLVAGLVLVVLTVLGRRALGPLVWFPKRWAPYMIGIVAGAVSAACALGFVAVVNELGVAPPPAAEAPSDVWVMVAMSVVLAPVVEEVFFRGWLQAAIFSDLPERRRHLAVVLAAAAFALAHVGSWLVPQLVLGVLAGLLYARTGALLPGILAHATHNALVVAWSLTV